MPLACSQLERNFTSGAKRKRLFYSLPKVILHGASSSPVRRRHFTASCSSPSHLGCYFALSYLSRDASSTPLTFTVVGSTKKCRLILILRRRAKFRIYNYARFPNSRRNVDNVQRICLTQRPIWLGACYNVHLKRKGERRERSNRNREDVTHLRFWSVIGALKNNIYNENNVYVGQVLISRAQGKHPHYVNISCS